MILHPTDLALSLFSTDDLPPRARRRVASHVGRCEKCFAYVAAMRSTAAIAAALPAPHTSDDGLAAVRARRDEGEHMLLPGESAEHPRPARRVAWPIAAAAVLIIAVAVLSSAPEVGAVAVESELTLSPSSPRARDSVRIVYRPIASLFGSENQLLLRARVRTTHGTAWGQRGQTVVTLDTLIRDRTGVFRGTFVLPDSVVFAVMAVEDFAAATVDDRDNRPWEVLVHGADGKPTFDALVQRENDYMGRSWEEAYATARQKTELYPFHIQSWSRLEMFERQVLGEARADSAARERQNRVDVILARYTAAPAVPSDELGDLLNRARRQNDSASTAYWWERIQQEAPRHPRAVEHATLLVLLGKHGGMKAPDSLLVQYENLWKIYGPVHSAGRVLLQAALGTAWHTNDAAAYRRWALRAMAESPASTRYYATNFLRYPETRAEGLGILRERLAGLKFGKRPLGWTIQQQVRSTDAERRRLLAAIGRGLLESGNSRGALDTLELAASDGWDLALFNEVAALRTKAGDTTGALAVLAKIAADPRTRHVQRDSLAAHATARLGTSKWGVMVADARRTMIHVTLAGSTTTLVPGDPQLTDSAGRPVRLRNLIAGNPALVVYWSRFCGPALEALPRIDSVATILRAQGGAAFLVVEEPPSPALSAFLRQHNVSTRVYHDTRREVSKAFRNFGTPAYYVLDPAGRIRFTWAPTEDDLLLQFAAVTDESSLRGRSPLTY